MRRIIIVLLVLLCVGTTVYADSPELAVKVEGVVGSTATVRLFSTEKTEEKTDYDLYTLRKINGRWEKEMYIRTISLPATRKPRKGKYRYYSKKYKVEHLTEGYVYALAPTVENAHYSKPFWKNLRGENVRRDN